MYIGATYKGKGKGKRKNKGKGFNKGGHKGKGYQQGRGYGGYGNVQQRKRAKESNSNGISQKE